MFSLFWPLFVLHMPGLFSTVKPVHTADTDKTKLSCLVLSVSAVWTELATRQDSFILLDPVSNLQLFSLKYIEDYWKLGNWKLGRDKTKLSCLVSSCVHTADTDKTRHSCLVRVGGVNKIVNWHVLWMSSPGFVESTNAQTLHSIFIKLNQMYLDDRIFSLTYFAFSVCFLLR